MSFRKDPKYDGHAPGFALAPNDFVAAALSTTKHCLGYTDKDIWLDEIDYSYDVVAAVADVRIAIGYISLPLAIDLDGATPAVGSSSVPQVAILPIGNAADTTDGAGTTRAVRIPLKGFITTSVGDATPANDSAAPKIPANSLIVYQAVDGASTPAAAAPTSLAGCFFRAKFRDNA